MTTNEKDIQIALGTYLPEVWTETCKLYAEGHKLWAEGDKLRDEGHKLCAEGRKLCAEGSKLWDEGDKLCAEGSKLWDEGDKLWAKGKKHFTDAVVEVYGKDIVKWTDYGCKVDNMEFRYDAH